MKFIRISVTPGFSPVQLRVNAETVLTVFVRQRKAVKTLVLGASGTTRLKPGVNEISQTIAYPASLT
jgi:hypothetical protein